MCFYVESEDQLAVLGGVKRGVGVGGLGFVWGEGVISGDGIRGTQKRAGVQHVPASCGE